MDVHRSAFSSSDPFERSSLARTIDVTAPPPTAVAPAATTSAAPGTTSTALDTYEPGVPAGWTLLYGPEGTLRQIPPPTAVAQPQPQATTQVPSAAVPAESASTSANDSATVASSIAVYGPGATIESVSPTTAQDVDLTVQSADGATIHFTSVGTDVNTGLQSAAGVVTTASSACRNTFTVTNAAPGTSFTPIFSYTAVNPVLVHGASGPPLAFGSTFAETSEQIEQGPIVGYFESGIAGADTTQGIRELGAIVVPPQGS